MAKAEEMTALVLGGGVLGAHYVSKVVTGVVALDERGDDDVVVPTRVLGLYVGSALREYRMGVAILRYFDGVGFGGHGEETTGVAGVELVDGSRNPPNLGEGELEGLLVLELERGSDKTAVTLDDVDG